MVKQFGKFKVTYVFDEEFSVQLLISGEAIAKQAYDIEDTGDIPVNLVRYENENLNFVFTYKDILGIRHTGTATISQDGTLTLEGALSCHTTLKDVKGNVSIYLEAGEPE